MRAWFTRLALGLFIGGLLFSVKSFALDSITANSVYTVYASTPVSTTPVTLLAHTAGIVRGLHVFDTSGVAMILTVTSGTGAGQRITSLYVPPGGDNYEMNMSKGDVIAISSLTGTVSTGVNIMTVLY